MNSNCRLTSVAVTIKDLITELHDVISWFQLGIYLDISPSELMKIRADHREKTDDCKTEMLMTWLRQTTNASWSAIVRALVGIRMGALTQKIAIKYGKSFLRITPILYKIKKQTPSFLVLTHYIIAWMH